MGPLSAFSISLFLSLLTEPSEDQAEAWTCPLPLFVPSFPASHWLEPRLLPAVVSQANEKMGMFFFRDAMPSKEQVQRRREQLEERLSGAVSWTDDLKWQPHLTIQASTWPIYDLFPEVEVLPKDFGTYQVEALVQGKLGPEYEKYVSRSASGRFIYLKRILPRGMTLSNSQGQKEGSVMFDDDVVIPAIWERRAHLGDDGKELRDEQGNVLWRNRDPVLWMSHTPFECMTLREGVKVSKGHTVVGGLGLGWQLLKIAARPKVTKVTVIDLNQDLVDWVMPRLAPHLSEGKVEVKIGDAYRILPTLTADVAVIDIWPHYGDIGMDLARMHGCSTGIEKFWGWGYGWKGQEYATWMHNYRTGRWKRG